MQFDPTIMALYHPLNLVILKIRDSKQLACKYQNEQILHEKARKLF